MYHTNARYRSLHCCRAGRRVEAQHFALNQHNQFIGPFAVLVLHDDRRTPEHLLDAGNFPLLLAGFLVERVERLIFPRSRSQ